MACELREGNLYSTRLWPPFKINQLTHIDFHLSVASSFVHSFLQQILIENLLCASIGNIVGTKEDKDPVV